MTDISNLPDEMLLYIFSFLPYSDLISVWGTSRQWRDLNSWPLAAKIQSAWANPSYYPSSVEVHCAAALAATSHLTSVEHMKLQDLVLPSSEDMLSLVRVVTGDTSRVVLRNVTGDISPLLSSLSCTWLFIENMEMDQAATSSLVWGLQHGIERLQLGFLGRVRLHIHTLLEYDGQGRCGWVQWWKKTLDTYKEEIKTWTARVNWSVKEENRFIEMTRCDDEDA